MSAPNPSDPRLLLPDWLRDADAPLPIPTAPTSARGSTALAEDCVAPEVVVLVAEPPKVTSSTPFSDRLSLDTRLDPNALVAATDLPAWLGGLEQIADSVPAGQPAFQAVSAAPTLPVAEPEPYDAVDAPEDGVIEVQINGWYILLAAIGLLLLIAAAARLFLS